MLFLTRHQCCSFVFSRAVLLLKCPTLPSARMLHTSAVSQHRSAIQEQAGDAKQIFQAAIDAVLPDKLVAKYLKVDGGQLSVNGQNYPLTRNVYIAAFGKAVSGMVSAAENILGDHLVGGVASVPTGMRDALKNAGKREMWPSSGKIEVIEGAANNMPDENSTVAALKIKQLAESLTPEDILLVLISGGGSALLSAPLPPVTLQEKQALTKLLSERGATIHELNAVRSKLSLLKGGKLAALADTNQIIALILSDVIGDPLDIIASGPTVSSKTTPERCMEIIHRYTTSGEVPDVIMNVLSQPRCEPTNGKLVNNVIVGNNAVAVEHSQSIAENLGYDSVVLSKSISGEARTIGETFAELAKSCGKLYDGIDNSSFEADVLSDLLRSFDASGGAHSKILSIVKENRPLCLIGAGETTVTLQGDGKGGRNQEMVLSWAVAAPDLAIPGFQVTFLSGGTDGQDGPTDAAGAWAYPGLEHHAAADGDGLDAVGSLEQNDSYGFFSSFRKGSNLVKTGLTGTNVMDIQILLLKPE